MEALWRLPHPLVPQLHHGCFRRRNNPPGQPACVQSSQRTGVPCLMCSLSLWLSIVRVGFCPETIPRRICPRIPCDYGLSNYVRVLHHPLYISSHLSIHSFPVIIVGMTQLLAFPLGMIRQPRVIAEVIAGIILGPTGLSSFPFSDKPF